MSSHSDPDDALPPKTINLYCRKCDSQIGICQNQWLQLPSAYAMPKDKGTDFGSSIADRQQPVLTKNDVRGCVLSEIKCSNCSEAIGQYCREAPNEKKHLLDRNWYRLPKIFLKDSRSFLRADPVFAKGYDFSRTPRSQSTFTALPRPAFSPSPYNHSVDGRPRALLSPSPVSHVAGDGQRTFSAPSTFPQSFGNEQGPYHYPPQHVHPSGYQDPAFQMTPMFNSGINSPFPRFSMPPPDGRRASSIAPEAPMPSMFNPDISFEDFNIPPLEVDSTTSQFTQQAIATILKRFDEQDAKFTKMTRSVHELKVQIGKLIASFRRSSLHNLTQDATIDALEGFMDSFESTVHASDDAEMKKLRGENESMKAKLQSIASAMGTVPIEPTPSSTPSSSPSIQGPLGSSLGKRKRTIETKRPSLLQNEVSITVLEDDEAADEVPAEGSALTKAVENTAENAEAATIEPAPVENTETETCHAATLRPGPLQLPLNCNSFVQHQPEQVLTPPGSNVPDDEQSSESQESSQKANPSNEPAESAIAASFTTSQERPLVPKSNCEAQPRTAETDSLASHDHAGKGTSPFQEAGNQSNPETRSDADVTASSATANVVEDIDNEAEAPPQPVSTRRTRQQTRRATEGIPPTKPATTSPVAKRQSERRKTTDAVVPSNEADKENHDPEEPKRKRKKTANAVLEEEQVIAAIASPNRQRRPLTRKKDNDVSVHESQNEKTTPGNERPSSPNPGSKLKPGPEKKNELAVVRPGSMQVDEPAPVSAQAPTSTATNPSDTLSHERETAASTSDPQVVAASIQPCTSTPTPTATTTTTLTNTTTKRPRRAPNQIERRFKCTFPGCDRAYGTLPHLNTHILQLQHGEKWTLKGYKERFEGAGGGAVGEGVSPRWVEGAGASQQTGGHNGPTSMDDAAMPASGPGQPATAAVVRVVEEEERLATIRHRERLAQQAMEMEDLLDLAAGA